MVILSIEVYSGLTEDVEHVLDVADRAAEESTLRYSHEEVFSKLREEVAG